MFFVSSFHHPCKQRLIAHYGRRSIERSIIVTHPSYYFRTLSTLSDRTVSAAQLRKQSRNNQSRVKAKYTTSSRLLSSASPPPPPPSPKTGPNQEQEDDNSNNSSKTTPSDKNKNTETEFKSEDNPQEEIEIKANKKTSEKDTKKDKYPPFFPWRHETELPQRLVDIAINNRGNDSNSSTSVGFETESYIISTATAWSYLNIPFYQVFGQGWRKELSDSCSYAFTQSMLQLLSNLYQVPIDKITTSKRNDNDETFGIDFDTKLLIEKKLTQNSRDNEDDKNNDNGLLLLESIMDPQLLNMYKSIHQINNTDSNTSSNGKDENNTNIQEPQTDSKEEEAQKNHNNNGNNLHVQLKMTPKSSYLYTLHCIPLISKNILEWKPSFLKDYHDYNNNKTSQNRNDLRSRLLNDYGKIESTIIAEVVLVCDELFRVTCATSGDVIQGGEGDDDAREVLHTARFEMIYSWSPETKGQIGDWILTDVDDLLDGNKWYRAPPEIPKSAWWLDG